MKSLVLIASLMLSCSAALATDHNPETDLAAALEAFDAYELDVALGLIEDFEARHGATAITLHRRVRIASLRAQLELARTQADVCMERFPDHPLCHEARGEAASLEILLGGNVLELLGAARTTRSAWERSVELDPTNARSQLLLLAYYRVAPWIAGGSKSKARAIEKDLLKRNPPKGLEARGYNALYDGDANAAARWFGEAHAALPNDRDPHWNYASALLRAERYEEALREWTLITDRYPRWWRAWLRRGMAAARGNLDAEIAQTSIAHFLENDQYAPPMAQATAHAGLGLIHEHAGNLDEARKAVRFALTLDDDQQDASAACERLGC